MTAAAQRGTTTVSERAVRRIAQQAATEALPRRDRIRTTEAAASVGGGRAEVSVGVTLPYPTPLADTVRDVQDHVTERTRHLTGLHVPPVRIDVTSLAPSVLMPVAAPPVAVSKTPPASPEPRTPRRRWSQRRLPVALLTLTAVVGFGALAFDLVRVHLAGRPAGGWRVRAVQWLTEHGLGNSAVVAAGGVTALLGAWMVVLAVTPGLRRQHTVHTHAPRLDAAVDRSAVASLVRDAVAGVEGVTEARVRVRGRRVAVRAGLAFGDRVLSQAAVYTAARDALAACRLRRIPRLRVTLTPESAWQPVRAQGAGDTDADSSSDSSTRTTNTTVPPPDAPHDGAPVPASAPRAKSASVTMSAPATGSDQ